jgi:EAL domain-containing protein (putative c-di-GMP-specific phosphodiesterase class I)
LKAIKEMGVSIAIDKFGTGYSSLSCLAKLPVEALKIDRAFTMNLISDADALATVSTIISLAHSLQLKVVAEGVETFEQSKALLLLKCDEIQGYLISPAIPATQFCEWQEQFLSSSLSSAKHHAPQVFRSTI